MVIRDWAAVSAMAAHGQVGLGETYVQGMWDTPSIEGLMTLAMNNRDHLGAYDQASPFHKAKFRLVDTVMRANSRRGSRRNIRSHYDVGNEFYGLWLDDGMTCSKLATPTLRVRRPARTTAPFPGSRKASAFSRSAVAGVVSPNRPARKAGM